MLNRCALPRTIAQYQQPASQWFTLRRPIPSPLPTNAPAALKSFHSSRSARALGQHDPVSFEPGKTYYDTLGLTPGAAPGEIKRKFYAASKIYHPDRNKDPSAQSHFVKLSQAYHVLSQPTEKAAYDKMLNQHQAAHVRSNPYVGTGPAGGRTASGLSRRRTTMRGPPPSYYRNQAYTGGGSSPRASGARLDDRTFDPSGGMGVGGQPSGTNHDVPHFNWDEKYKQHRDYQSRQARQAWNEAEAQHLQGANFWFQAAIVGGSVLFCGAMGGWLVSKKERRNH